MMDYTRTCRIALVGTPNCGKTSLFNALTGSRQRVGNYPGVTVERKSGRFRTPEGRIFRVIDLPGTYSLRARSPDEVITRDVVLGRMEGHNPEMLMCVADATNLRLALRLVLELKHTGIPLLLVLNMADIAKKRGFEINIPAMEKALGLPVTTAVAVRSGGLCDMLAKLDTFCNTEPKKQDTSWSTPSGAELRALQREADTIIRATVTYPQSRDGLTEKLDTVLLHPVFGMIALFVLMFLMFQAVFVWAQPAMDLIDGGFGALGDLARQYLPAGLFQSFITDGIIAGVGSVVVFLPQILILFFFILLLEDFGYMARAAFLMDRIMGGAGLHGRAFIPLLSSFACAIPGIMAARVIDQPRDRLTTILVAPLMTCSARIPVYTLIISAFIPPKLIWGWANLQGLVMFGLYAAGIVSALMVSFVAKKFVWRGQPSPPFMLELPDYKLPQAKGLLLGLWQRAKAFLTRAGTTIFAIMVLIWFLASFPAAPAGAHDPAINYSFAAMLGRLFEPLLAPVGFNWQIAMALVPGMAAREVAVAALGTVYSISGTGDGNVASLLAGQWSLATALSFLVWYIFAPQCASTLAVIRRETGSNKWMIVSFAYMLALAYAGAFLTYHVAQYFGA
ncbi:MAG: ferrous iron transport protein B [Rhizomicrobium sp.]